MILKRKYKFDSRDNYDIINKDSIIDCSRRGKFGNPYYMKNKSINERNRVINLFEESFEKRFRIDLFLKVLEIKRNKGIKIIYLECYCKRNERCHCDIIIKRYNSLNTLYNY